MNCETEDPVYNPNKNEEKISGQLFTFIILLNAVPSSFILFLRIWNRLLREKERQTAVKILKYQRLGRDDEFFKELF
jgi:hypothetical protein